MGTRPSPKNIRHGVADFLLAVSAGYIGITVWGSPWFPYDVALAIVGILFSWAIGDYRYRWWPATPFRDHEHEFLVEQRGQSMGDSHRR